ncbi:hypothetical protein CSHISOI_09524 [Colletotrichum shisoi]|uniref:Uncharacterized protein n=1 Tax=Colletotrichum shisoi TaxID=2078593 RepID=A0A5Q4BG24_9PEZI|nr:hypothetical protein CSHISOI_09524 [Colletotrichum shisoi]
MSLTGPSTAAPSSWTCTTTGPTSSSTSASRPMATSRRTTSP